VKRHHETSADHHAIARADNVVSLATRRIAEDRQREPAEADTHRSSKSRAPDDDDPGPTAA
jgi:hypothetical protein